MLAPERQRHQVLYDVHVWCVSLLAPGWSWYCASHRLAVLIKPGTAENGKMLVLAPLLAVRHSPGPWAVPLLCSNEQGRSALVGDRVKRGEGALSGGEGIHLSVACSFLSQGFHWWHPDHSAALSVELFSSAGICWAPALRCVVACYFLQFYFLHCTLLLIDFLYQDFHLNRTLVCLLWEICFPRKIHAVILSLLLVLFCPWLHWRVNCHMSSSGWCALKSLWSLGPFSLVLPNCSVMNGPEAEEEAPWSAGAAVVAAAGTLKWVAVLLPRVTEGQNEAGAGWRWHWRVCMASSTTGPLHMGTFFSVMGRRYKRRRKKRSERKGNSFSFYSSMWSISV